jgi:hypothetical protein
MSWLKQFFSRRQVYDDLSDEIRGHLEEKVEELVAGGMSRKDASAARRGFGNVTLIEEDGRAAPAGREGVRMRGETRFFWDLSPAGIFGRRSLLCSSHTAARCHPEGRAVCGPKDLNPGIGLSGRD